MYYSGPLSPEEERRRKEDDRLLKEAKDKNWRALFAAIVTMIFASGMAGLEWRFAVAVCLIVYSAIILWVWTGVAVIILNYMVARPFMKTNNRWFVWMCVYIMTLATVLFVFTPFGGQQAAETSARYSAALDKVTSTQSEQRLNNAAKYGRALTDAEMIERGYKVDHPVQTVTPPTLNESVPVDMVRYNWFIRFWCLVALILLTICYFFFAFADEAKEGAQKVASKIREKTEGDPVKAVATNVAPIVGTVMGADAGAGVLRKAADEVFWNTAIDSGQKWLKRITNYVKQGVRR